MGSPWQRYRPLIAVMVWMDILGSVTQNKGSRLLPTYRRLLSHFPAQRDSGARLAMEHVWGCDDTTVRLPSSRDYVQLKYSSSPWQRLFSYRNGKSIASLLVASL